MADVQPTPREGETRTINLQILSPSPLVGPMRFPNLAVSTTVGELKAKIRELVETRPSDEHMRLIYQARFLSRDADTLLDVFGEDVIRASDQQTLHLALRDPAPNASGTASSAQNTAAASRATHTSHHNNQPHNHHQQPAANPIGPHVAHQGGIFLPPNPLNHAAQQFALNAAAHQNALRQAAMTHAQVSQQAVAVLSEDNARLRRRIEALEQGRGATLRGEVGEPGEATMHQHATPNGTNVRITTFEVPTPRSGGPSSDGTSATATYPSSQLPLPRANTLRATQTITDAMQRSASGASISSMATNLANANRNGPIQPIQPGVTTPLFPGVSRHASRTATPDPFARSASQLQAQGQPLLTPQQLHLQPQTWSQPQSRAQSRARRGQGSTEVYIVDTPAGPHSLLVNNGSEMYEQLVLRPQSASYPAPLTRASQVGLQLPVGYQIQPGLVYPTPLQYPVYYLPPGLQPAPSHQAQTTSYQVQARFQVPPGYQPSVGFPQPTPHLPVQSPQPQVQPHVQPQPVSQIQPNEQVRAQAQRAVEQLQALNARLEELVRNREEVGGRQAALDLPAPGQGAAAEPPAAPAPQAQPAPPAVPVIRHPANPGPGAVVAALWPHVWLIVRLVAFAWWFSYSNPSWERWLSLAIAFVVVFAINTGVLNGVVNDAFNPVREQLEGMLPPLANAGGQDQGQEANQQDRPGNQNDDQADPNPAETARRLVAQRRIANGTWLRDQARWLERAGVLLLASLAPGVAERHIRQLEEREMRERAAAQAAAAERERLAQEAAVAAAAAANQETENAQDGQGNEGQENHGDDGQEGPIMPPAFGHDHLQQQQHQAHRPVDPL